MSARKPPQPGLRIQRLVRQLHLWIGAWGAIAAILFGATGLILNHRLGDGAWPQGTTTPTGKRTLAVPIEARDSAEALSLWLRRRHGLDAQIIRKPKPEDAGKGPPKWSLSGGTARNGWSVDHVAGEATLTLKFTRSSPLAVFNKLHKGIGGGRWWTWLVDSYAVAMLVLGVTGIWMWARGRSLRQTVLSVMTLGLGVLASAVLLAFA